MRLPWMRAIASFLFSATLSAPAWANANANSAVPGTLNYVEGKVSIGEETLDSKSIGSAEVKPGQSLTTGSGKAEVLLTPGVFLRVGDNSTRSEEHTSELQSRLHLVCRLLLEKKKTNTIDEIAHC